MYQNYPLALNKEHYYQLQQWTLYMDTAKCPQDIELKVRLHY